MRGLAAGGRDAPDWRCAIVLALAGTALGGWKAEAQSGASLTRTHTVSAEVPNLASVAAVSNLMLLSDDGMRVYLQGAVETATMNGPYRLQAQLSADPGDTVWVVSPPAGILVPLMTTTWVTVAQGPPGPTGLNRVTYVRASAAPTESADSSRSRDPGGVAAPSLRYRVVIP